MAAQWKPLAEPMAASQSFASRRLRPIQAKKRSTSQRWGRTAPDPLAGVSGIGEDARGEGERGAREAEHGGIGVAILDAFRVGLYDEAAAVYSEIIVIAV